MTGNRSDRVGRVGLAACAAVAGVAAGAFWLFDYADPALVCFFVAIWLFLVALVGLSGLRRPDPAQELAAFKRGLVLITDSKLAESRAWWRDHVADGRAALEAFGNDVSRRRRASFESELIKSVLWLQAIEEESRRRTTLERETNQ